MNGATQQLLYLYCLTGAEQLDVRGKRAKRTAYSHKPAGMSPQFSAGYPPRISVVEPGSRTSRTRVGWSASAPCGTSAWLSRCRARDLFFPRALARCFPTTGVLAQFVKMDQETIVGFLDTVRDHEEWGIKAQLERAKAKRSL